MTLFLSDLHLGAAYIADPRAHEMLAVNFLRTYGKEARQIFLLGDVLDYWFEYRTVVPRGHIRFFGELARLSDAGVKITWLTGNHDIWLFDYLSSELGIEVVDAPWIEREIDGKRFVLAHGDRIGSGSVGFKIISRLFRSRLCQRAFACIHPGLTVPLALKWSRSSRESGCGSDTAAHRANILADALTLLSRCPDADFIIMGHHHLPMQELIPGSDTLLTVLGGWHREGSYAVFDGSKLSLSAYGI